MSKTGQVTNTNVVSTVAKRKCNLIILLVALIIVSFEILKHLISAIIPELQKLIGCKKGIIAYSDCKYTGLASIITAPVATGFLVTFIIAAVLLYKKRKKVIKSKEIDPATEILLCTNLFICTAMALFITVIAVYGIVAWS